LSFSSYSCLGREVTTLEGSPTTLANCVEHDTQATSVTCDPLGTTNNPWINAVAVSPDGTLLATVSEDSNQDGKVTIFRLNGNTPRDVAKHVPIIK
jgi:hypothetical protein